MPTKRQAEPTCFIEWFGVWVFAAYWLTKSAEFRITSAEKRALKGELKRVEGVGLVPVSTANRSGAILRAQAATAVTFTGGRLMPDNATIVTAFLKKNRGQYFCHACVSDGTSVKPQAQVTL